IEYNSGSNKLVIIDNITLVDKSTGNTPGNGGGLHITGNGDVEINGGIVADNVAGREGGGLWNGSGTMRLEGVTVENNIAEGNATDDGGGGIFNNGGTVNIEQSTIANNRTTGAMGTGAGIHNPADASVNILNSTISGNQSNNNGGGVYNAGAYTSRNATIANNVTAGSGGGIYTEDTGTATIVMTLLADNTGVSGGNALGGTGMYFSEGYNLVADDDAMLLPPADGDIFDVDPRLMPLMDNGGATETHAIDCDSPANNAGINETGFDEDQRGLPIFATRDIGAFELQDSCVTDAIANVGMPLETTLYPNVVRAEQPIYLSIPTELSEALTLRITSLSSGKMIAQRATRAGVQQLSFREQASGSYLVQIIADKRVETHKVIVLE
ncbi:MAG: T9SS type A sorting domain-containing protein, partial [Bacteroidota bacterium]